MEIEIMYLLWILLIMIVFIATVFGFLVYSGLLHQVEIRAGKSPVGDLIVAYKFARGPYKNAGELFTEITCLAPKMRCIGVYYDDPNQVDPEDLRYIVGCILAEGSQAPNDNLLELLQSKGFKLCNFPTVSHVVMTTFPFKNTFSIFLGIMRVYPRLAEYIKERHLCAHPMMEIYDNKTIYFVAPLSRQDEFYVPEVLDDNIHDSEDENLIDTDNSSILEHSSSLQEQIGDSFVSSYNESKEEDDIKDSKSQELSPPILEPVHSHQPSNKNGKDENSDQSGSSFEEITVGSTLNDQIF